MSVPFSSPTGTAPQLLLCLFIAPLAPQTAICYSEQHKAEAELPALLCKNDVSSLQPSSVRWTVRTNSSDPASSNFMLVPSLVMPTIEQIETECYASRHSHHKAQQGCAKYREQGRSPSSETTTRAIKPEKSYKFQRFDILRAVVTPIPLPHYHLVQSFLVDELFPPETQVSAVTSQIRSSATRGPRPPTPPLGRLPLAVPQRLVGEGKSKVAPDSAAPHATAQWAIDPSRDVTGATAR
eukprot:745965-Hanusia_phi.AAC.4